MIELTLPQFRASTVSPSNKVHQSNLSQIPPDLTFTPLNKLISRKHKSISIEGEKNQYKLDLTLNHSIIRAMAFADKEQESLKDNSSLTHGFKRMSAGMQLIRNSDQPKLFHTINQHFLPFKRKVGDVTLKNPTDSQIKCVSTQRNRWIKHRGIEMAVRDSKSFVSFLRQLFDALDEDESGRITADELIFPLLAYGLCPNPYYFEAALRVFFKTDDINSISLEREEFVNMFKEETKTDHILKYLDENTKIMIGSKEETQRHGESTEVWKKSEEVNERPKFLYCGVEDYVKMLRKWWAELRPINDSVHISKVAEFLAEKSIVSNKHEGMRVIKETCENSIICYLDYEKVFLKAIFKAALLNLAAGLDHGELSELEPSLRLKISNYQRSLMIKGTDPDFEFALGRNTLQAIGRYQAAKPEISRNKATKDIKNTVALAEDAQKGKIKEYLYKLKTRAKEFVNDKGEVITSMKNTWDIRDIVESKFAKTISIVPEEQKTFDEFSYLKEIAKVKNIRTDKKPMPRKVKTFRENYILERYQRLILSPKNECKS